jgi:GH15 family glucan-1,4-alpha-glucosidase
MLDKDKGKSFTVNPKECSNITTQQQYLPSSNILQTKYLRDDGALNLIDFFPRPAKGAMSPKFGASGTSRELRRPKKTNNLDLKKWLVRRVECIRGEVEIGNEVLPAFNYGQDPHTAKIVSRRHETVLGEHKQHVIFASKSLSLELSATVDCGDEAEDACPNLDFQQRENTLAFGDSITADFVLKEGQAVSFVLRDHTEANEQDYINTSLLDRVQEDTQTF